MAVLRALSGPKGLEIAIRPMNPDNSDDLLVTYRLFIDENRVVEHISRTRDWQVARVYFEVLARSFQQCEVFGDVRFPRSFYSNPPEEWPRTAPFCTLSHLIGDIRLFMRCARQGRLSLDCYLVVPDSDTYANCSMMVSLEAARTFGNQLMEELDAPPHPYFVARDLH